MNSPLVSTDQLKHLQIFVAIQVSFICGSASGVHYELLTLLRGCWDEVPWCSGAPPNVPGKDVFFSVPKYVLFDQKKKKKRGLTPEKTLCGACEGLWVPLREAALPISPAPLPSTETRGQAGCPRQVLQNDHASLLEARRAAMHQ